MRARLIALLATLGTFLPPAGAQDLVSTVRPAADAIYAAGTPPALVIAVVQGESVFIQGYGETAPGSGVTPDGRSLVRLASLSKLLTSDVLAAMTQDGLVTLVDTLQQHAPMGRKVPLSTKGDPITLLNLATHTSGLAREGIEPRWDWLESQPAKELKAPGTVARYSNVGFDLLADALADAGRAPYPALLADYTTAPLGMHDTTPAPDPEQCIRLIVGGIPEAPCEDQTIIAGDGGIYSTAADMALWMRYQLGIGEAADGTRRAIAQHIYVDRATLVKADGLDHAGRAAGVGLAWIRLRPVHWFGPSLLEKTGNIGGFTSYIALELDHQVGVFVVMTRPAKARKAMGAIIHGVNDLVTALATGTALPVLATETSGKESLGGQ